MDLGVLDMQQQGGNERDSVWRHDNRDLWMAGTLIAVEPLPARYRLHEMVITHIVRDG